jgi:hypothetical protein
MLETTLPRGSRSWNCSTEDMDQHHRVVCLYAARLAFSYMAVFLDSIQGETQTQVIFAWATGVDTVFWDLCETRHPVALVILAHFAVLMSLSRGCGLRSAGRSYL